MARLVTGKGKYETITEEVSLDLKWLYPKLLNEYKVLCLTYKLVKCRNIKVFMDYYKRTSDTHSYPATSGNRLSINYPFKGNYGFGTFHYRSISFWNNLPKKIEEIKSYANFKIMLKQNLLKRQLRIHNGNF